MFFNTHSVFAEVIQSVIENGKYAPDRKAGKKGGLSIQQRFDIFDRNNPLIYELLVAGAHDAIGEGHKAFGIAFIFERIRWKLPIQTYGEDFKLNNDYRARYVRKIESNEPGLVGFFRKRSLRSL
jgi:hypothetical protein